MSQIDPPLNPAGPPARRRWVGQPIPRREDGRLLTGLGRFVDDLPFNGLVEAAILRSPHAHARILAIDPSAALARRGVIAVLTGREMAERARPFGVVSAVRADYYPIAVDKVRYVGEPVAVVIARDRYLAEDALEDVAVAYDPLPAVVDPEIAAGPDAPILHDHAGTNVAIHRDLRYGDPDGAFREADEIVEATFRFPKYSSTPIETYGVVAQWDAAGGVLTIWSNFHGPFVMHALVARALRLPENRLRFIVAPDIGGSFGIKISSYPYLALIGLAAMKAGGRPVKWIEDRLEHLAASSSGAGRTSHVAAALRRDGTITALRYRQYDNVGAYIRATEPGSAFRTLSNQTGAYAVPNLALDAYVVMTNVCPTGPNRGYGCPPLYFGLERIVDLAARRLGLDPVEMRRRNLIRADQIPYATPSGGLYESGDYGHALDLALAKADYAGLRAEQERARSAGRMVGIGIATVVEPAVSNLGYITVAIPPEIRARPDYEPKSGSGESATVKMDPLGQVNVVVASAPSGQGHETVIAQIVADELGLTPDEITVTSELDTFKSDWSVSTGSYASRFAAVGNSALVQAAGELRERLLALAGHLLEADPADLELREGRIQVKGAPARALTLKQIAGSSHWNPDLQPEGQREPGLRVSATVAGRGLAAPDDQDRVNCSSTYGFIADVVVVDVDPETGEVAIRKYVSVHDAGRVLNPALVEGQIQGGATHGIGGALYEEMVYDESGQLLSGTFQDYLCPTVHEVPAVEADHVASLSPNTALGAKGAGESNTISAPPAIANAVADAIGPAGDRVVELPLTPAKVWRWLTEGPAS